MIDLALKSPLPTAEDLSSRLASLKLALVRLPNFYQRPSTYNGIVLPLQGRLCPRAVGPDIGCGVLLTVVDMPPSELKARRIQRWLEIVKAAVPTGPGLFPSPTQWPELDRFEAEATPAAGWLAAEDAREDLLRSLGTLGGGGHFVELGVVESPEQPRGMVYLLVHSGSRILGRLVYHWWGRHYRSTIPEDTAPAKTYYRDVGFAGAGARYNRELIMEQALRALFLSVPLRHRNDPIYSIDSPHSALTAEVINGQEVWVHRQGAIPAYATPTLNVVLGLPGRESWVVRGTGALHSAASGLGRCMPAAEARYRFGDAHNPMAFNRPSKFWEIEDMLVQQIGSLRSLGRWPC